MVHRQSHLSRQCGTGERRPELEGNARRAASSTRFMRTWTWGCVLENEVRLRDAFGTHAASGAASASQTSPWLGLAWAASEVGLDEARRRRAKSGWEAGIRTPITASRARCPTVERPPSLGRTCRAGTPSLPDAPRIGNRRLAPRLPRDRRRAALKGFFLLTGRTWRPACPSALSAGANGGCGGAAREAGARHRQRSASEPPEPHAVNGPWPATVLFLPTDGRRWSPAVIAFGPADPSP